MTEIIIYSDGAARGNPGPAGAGAILLDAEGRSVGSVCRYLGETTNNQAEYQALLLALHEAISLGAPSVSVFADSELMVKQIRGEYKVKNEGLRPLYKDIMNLLRRFKGYRIEHVPREKNKRADRLANIAIDDQVL
jgi:ribonuclease HI